MNYSDPEQRTSGWTETLSMTSGKNGFRTGWFYPNELGAKLMPTATGVGPAMRASVEAGKNLLSDPDVISSVRYVRRGWSWSCAGRPGRKLKPGGCRSPIRNIFCRLLIFLTATDSVEPLDCEHELTEELDSEGGDVCLEDDEVDEPWLEAEESPRYQIQVFLVWPS